MLNVFLGLSIGSPLLTGKEALHLLNDLSNYTSIRPLIQTRLQFRNSADNQANQQHALRVINIWILPQTHDYI